MKKIFIGAIVVAFILSVSSFSKPATANAGNQLDKLGSGVAHLTLGCTDIIKKPIVRTVESGNPFWIIGGFIEGIFTAADKTLAGLADVVTFPIGDSRTEGCPLESWE